MGVFLAKLTTGHRCRYRCRQHLHCCKRSLNRLVQHFRNLYVLDEQTNSTPKGPQNWPSQWARHTPKCRASDAIKGHRLQHRQPSPVSSNNNIEKRDRYGVFHVITSVHYVTHTWTHNNSNDSTHSLQS